ncbi:MAG: 1-acyl-sn-glycerol-3-phosphate acyltransferase [Bacteroidia bacterium]|nr:1-acyl-sn-glycerol-3-phosphate acyltransferase [Bacteroidia bacterium]
MKNFSFIYELSWYIYRPGIRTFYSRLQEHGKENFPKKDAVLVCCNHVNAFMDAISMQVSNSRQIFSLARGDAFGSSFMSWLLGQWKIIPIYRLSEGAENLKKNDESFATSHHVLQNRNPLIIYPEAICVQEKRLRKLKKGAARIAFSFIEKNNFESDLLILPVGMNYSDPKKFRSDLLINYGKPLSVLAYADLYKRDKPRAINEFTAALEIEMKKLLVHIEHPENDELVEQIYTIYKPLLFSEQKFNLKKLTDDFTINQLVADAVNYFHTNNRALIETAKQKMKNYFDWLNEFKITDSALDGNKLKTLTMPRIVADIVLLIAGTPFYLLGLLMNYMPYKLGLTVANKLAKDVEFHASINLAVGWTIWLIYALLQLLIVGLLFHNWILLLSYAVLIPLTAGYSLCFYRFLVSSTDRRRALRLKQTKPNKFNEILKQRENIIELLNNAKENYCRLLKTQAKQTV